MKQVLLTILRNAKTQRAEFREAADKLSSIMAIEACALLSKSVITVDTPVGSAQGHIFDKDIFLLPIMRAGLAMLNPFMRFFPACKVGFIGIRRQEITAAPVLYYKNMPKAGKDDVVFILDPMLATGGSSLTAIQAARESGTQDDKIILVSLVASPEGLKYLENKAPGVRIVAAQVDQSLNQQKFIVPGIGDFGDRYFGTENYVKS